MQVSYRVIRKFIIDYSCYWNTSTTIFNWPTEALRPSYCQNYYFGLSWPGSVKSCTVPTFRPQLREPFLVVLLFRLLTRKTITTVDDLPSWGRNVCQVSVCACMYYLWIHWYVRNTFSVNNGTYVSSNQHFKVHLSFNSVFARVRHRK